VLLLRFGLGQRLSVQVGHGRIREGGEQSVQVRSVKFAVCPEAA